jgi:hypothetical protein
MDTIESCEALQERMVRGEPLDAARQTHVAGCPTCSALAAEWLALESAIADSLDAGAVVPAGFADRVMARLESGVRADAGVGVAGVGAGNAGVAEMTAAGVAAATRLDGLLGRRWFQIALAQLGVVAAAANLIRVIFAALVPTSSLGGSP